MRTIGKVSLFAATAAAIAWLGFSGFAVASGSNPVDMSCDVNQGSVCSSTFCGLGNNEIPYCSLPDSGGHFECLCEVGTGTNTTFNEQTIPNSAACTFDSADSLKCGSTHCLPDSGPFYDGGDILPGWCCAEASQTFDPTHPLACLSTSDIDGFHLESEKMENPYVMGCIATCTPYVTTYLYPPNTPEVCGGSHACQGPNWEGLWDYYQSWVDAGTNPLGGPQHLMKADNIHMAAPGLNQAVPLGWTGPVFMGGLNGAGAGHQVPPFATDYYPNYFCQMPYYLPDGGWALESAGSTHEDLMECGGSPDDQLTTGYFPCCGQEHDAGRGMPDLCQPDVNGVRHCACVQDGHPCDRPRYLDNTSWAGVPVGHSGGHGQFGHATAQYEGMGECCSPGLTGQSYSMTVFGTDGGTDKVIAQGQGFCRPDPVDGLTPSAGSVQAPGYCNCLPVGVACNTVADCCPEGLAAVACIADGGHATCCYPLGFFNCHQNSDCCGATNDPAVAGNVCNGGECSACTTANSTCTTDGQCCTGSCRTSPLGTSCCINNFDTFNICFYDTECCADTCNARTHQCGCQAHGGPCNSAHDCCNATAGCNLGTHTCV